MYLNLPLSRIVVMINLYKVLLNLDPFQSNPFKHLTKPEIESSKFLFRQIWKANAPPRVAFSQEKPIEVALW